MSADVALDGAEAQPVVGSFTSDGLTFAVVDKLTVELVGVTEGAGALLQRDAASPSGVAASDASSDPALALAAEDKAEGSVLALSDAASYEGADYVVASVGAYAFYLSGVTDVVLPASVSSVDERAFRSSDVASVEVAAGNPALSSYDGVLYSADMTSLLLIPEGRTGAVRVPSHAASVEPSAFSHCARVDAIAVDAGCSHLSSEDGLLYSADGATLLRVPAGATDITIRDGCTAIAAGAMEGCAKLSTINAPASVTSISPDVFTSVPTVSLPAASVADDAEGFSQAEGAEGVEGDGAPQLTAMVALLSANEGLPEVNPSSIKVCFDEEKGDDCWSDMGFTMVAISEKIEPEATATTANTFQDTYVSLYANGGRYQTSQYPGTIHQGPSIAQSLVSGTRVTFSSTSTTATIQFSYTGIFDNPGSTFVCYSSQKTYPGGTTWTSGTRPWSGGWCIWNTPITWDANGGYWNDDPADTADKLNTWTSNTEVSGYNGSMVPQRAGYEFAGWESSLTGMVTEAGVSMPVLQKTTYSAQWKRVDYDLGFDVDSEPGDEDYPGIEKPDETVNVESGPTVIEDPKRPGYVFQGWVIPSESGIEAIDQDLVYQDETDGKWYVDASKLPDYANNEGRVELTARWTSVISVDVPSAVTFYADVVTEGQESREGAASSAFGQNKVASQSEVDLRIVGLESNAVETQGSTLGADSILKKAASATPSSSTQKLFSLYPTSKALTPDDLQDPDAVSAAKPADAVDFALDDILLEKSFAAEKFTIPAGDTLNLGYRLNLSETGTELDYDKLSTLDEGQSASIANISYCFATMLHHPTATGSTSDDLYIEHKGRIYGLDDIKASADCIAAFGEESPCYQLYSSFMASGMDPGDSSDAHGYVRWGDGTVYSVRIIGISYDDKADASGKASLTFEFVNLLNTPYQMRSDGGNAGGWGASLLRDQMNPYSEDELLSASGTGNNSIWDDVPMSLRQALVPVGKKYYRTYSNLNTLSRSSDYLFIRGLGETCVTFISASTWPNELPFLHGERPDDCSGPYQYFAMLGINQTVSESINLVSCGYEKSPAIPARHWQRSLYVDYPHTFCSFEKYGSGSINETLSTNFFGVRPAFCL